MPHATIRPEHILRAREVVARLSVEEKVAQLEAVPFTHFLDESGRFSEAKAEEIAKYGVGIVKRVYGNGANSWVGELDLRNLALVPFESDRKSVV